MPKSFEQLAIRPLIKVLNCHFVLRCLSNMIVIDYFQTISDRPVLPSVEAGFMRESLPSEIPAEGVKWDEIQPDIERIIMVGRLQRDTDKIVARDNPLAASKVFLLVSV